VVSLHEAVSARLRSPVPAPSVRDHLAGLVGAVIPTFSASPIRVIRVENDSVIVGTDKSPSGEPVPLAEIQAAADRVFDGEEVRIDPASVGYLRASVEGEIDPAPVGYLRGFVEAVLMSMPGVEVVPRPWRVRLAERGAPPDPEWEYDELVLTIDQYLNTNVYVEASDPAILALSDLLGRLPVHDRDVDRSPDAVLGMLHRWKAIDPAHWEEFDPRFEGPGPPWGTAREKAVWVRFITQDASLAELDAAVASIRALAEEGAADLSPVDDESEVIEGRLLFRHHRMRERDPEITRRKKAAIMERLGRLACEVCDFDFAAAYGQLGEGFIECHHRLPLATAGIRTTQLDDLALVCPNCHRMLHRSHPTLTVEALRKLIRP
jgi:5-methylcytosine-specific restriction protein A